VAYSPLGRGFLTGRFRSPDDLDANDWRRTNPRFQGENFQKNLKLADCIRELAEKKGCTPAQLALAWLLVQGKDIVPIPGTRTFSRLKENAESANIALSNDELDEIAAVLPEAVGARYPEASMAVVNG
jgi:aryl-alcohol dehydrogenase-like predicted oxidoreductase